MATNSQSGPQNRKRRYAEAELLQDDLPSKKFKSRELHSSNHPPPAFWDNLSKVRLTPQALEELDRRNTQYTSNQSPTQPKAKEPRTRSTDREYLSKVETFARQGGPDLSDLKGYPAPIDPLCPTMGGAGTISKKNIKPCSPIFERNLVRGQVYPPGYRYPGGKVPSPPRNLEEVNRILKERRPSLSPSRFSNEEFRELQYENANAVTEKDVGEFVIPIIRGNTKDKQSIGNDIPFKNLDSLTDGTLAPNNPNLFYGARLEELDPQICNELGRFIMPSAQDTTPLAPNFFLAVEGNNGSAAVAYRQSCYYGALGARGMQKLQSYRQIKPVYDQNAYTITATYHYGALNIYTTHIIPPARSGQPPKYYMTQCDGFSLIGNPGSCRQGITAFRNARDWTEKMRNQFISDANKRVRSRRAESPILGSSNGPLDITETYPAEGPGPSQDELASSPSQDELTISPSQDELTISPSQAELTISPSHSVAISSPQHYNEASDILEELETSADELALPSEKRRKVSEKTTSKGTRTFRQKR